MKMSTRAKTAALAAAVAILSAAAPPPARSADAGPIKVALLAPTSGSAAAAGHDMVAGWQLYWKEHDNKVAGRTVQTTVYDTAYIISKGRVVFDGDPNVIRSDAGVRTKYLGI